MWVRSSLCDFDGDGGDDGADDVHGEDDVDIDPLETVELLENTDH